MTKFAQLDKKTRKKIIIISYVAIMLGIITGAAYAISVDGNWEDAGYWCADAYLTVKGWFTF